jgi:hypothetical protein
MEYFNNYDNFDNNNYDNFEQFNNQNDDEQSNEDLKKILFDLEIVEKKKERNILIQKIKKLQSISGGSSGTISSGSSDTISGGTISGGSSDTISGGTISGGTISGTISGGSSGTISGGTISGTISGGSKRDGSEIGSKFKSNETINSPIKSEDLIVQTLNSSEDLGRFKNKIYLGDCFLNKNFIESQNFDYIIIELTRTKLKIEKDNLISFKEYKMKFNLSNQLTNKIVNKFKNFNR